MLVNVLPNLFSRHTGFLQTQLGTENNTVATTCAAQQRPASAPPEALWLGTRTILRRSQRENQRTQQRPETKPNGRGGGRLQKEPQTYAVTRASGRKACVTSTKADSNTIRRAEGRAVVLGALLDPNQSFALGDG